MGVRLEKELWGVVSDVYEAILRHPFITGLTDGSLPEDVFKHYIIQDSLFLDWFSRALAVTASKAERNEDSIVLLSNARDVLLVEKKSLHDFLLDRWGVETGGMGVGSMSLANIAYTSYLLSVAYSRPFHESLAALLPCFWVYWRVGLELVKRGSPNELYDKWIKTYSSEEFSRSVEAVLDLAGRAYDKASNDERRKMKTHFRLSTIFEYLFWDSAYRVERLPFKL